MQETNERMKKNGLLVCFVIIMFIVVAFVAWYLPALGKVRFQIEETEKSLETSLGREKKQSYELGKTIACIPVVRMKLDLVSPLADAAHEEVVSLKSERKTLRSEKKELEEKQEAGNGQEDEKP